MGHNFLFVTHMGNTKGFCNLEIFTMPYYSMINLVKSWIDFDLSDSFGML